MRNADPAAELVKLATTHASRGEFREALAAARRALAARPSHAALLANLGSIFSACQRFEEARSCFAGAVAAQKDNPAGWYGLATAQRALGDFDAAETSCAEALRLDPRHAESHWL